MAQRGPLKRKSSNNMQIQIKEVGAPYKSGNYYQLELKYIRDGKEETRKLTAVGETKNVMQVLRSASAGDVYEIKLEKSVKGDKTYWNWVGATKVEGAAAQAVAAQSQNVGRGNYETAEERAKRQVYIARQSSLERAIEFAGRDVPVATILDLANQFTQFVFEGLPAVEADEPLASEPAKPVEGRKRKPSEDFDDDLPWDK